MPYQLRFGHRAMSNSTVLPMPSTLILSDENEEKGYRLQMNEAGELTITSFDHNGTNRITIEPNTANQITLK